MTAAGSLSGFSERSIARIRISVVHTAFPSETRTRLSTAPPGIGYPALLLVGPHSLADPAIAIAAAAAAAAAPATGRCGRCQCSEAAAAAATAAAAGAHAPQSARHPPRARPMAQSMARQAPQCNHRASAAGLSPGSPAARAHVRRAAMPSLRTRAVAAMPCPALRACLVARPTPRCSINVEGFNNLALTLPTKAARVRRRRSRRS